MGTLGVHSDDVQMNESRWSLNGSPVLHEVSGKGEDRRVLAESDENWLRTEKEPDYGDVEGA